MPKFDIKRFLSMVTASYGKRLLEKPYDKLAQTELFQKLKDQPLLAKQIIEAASYALTALFEQNTGKSGPIKGAFDEVLMDMGPELSKRMLNGNTGPLTINAEKYTAKLEKPAEKLFVQILLENLDLEKVTALAAWLKNATPEEKSNILKYIKGLNAEKIVGLIRLSTADAGELLTIFEKPKIESPKRITLLDAIERKLRQHRDSLVQQKGEREHGQN